MSESPTIDERRSGHDRRLQQRRAEDRLAATTWRIAGGMNRRAGLERRAGMDRRREEPEP